MRRQQQISLLVPWEVEGKECSGKGVKVSFRSSACLWLLCLSTQQLHVHDCVLNLGRSRGSPYIARACTTHHMYAFISEQEFPFYYLLKKRANKIKEIMFIWMHHWSSNRNQNAENVSSLLYVSLCVLKDRGFFPKLMCPCASLCRWSSWRWICSSDPHGGGETASTCSLWCGLMGMMVFS